MGNTFVDGQEKIVERDFVTVRTSGGRLVFMGERKNIKCFDRLKKVSARVFETLSGQTYKFLDKMPEPAAEPKTELSPEMQARAEASYRAYKENERKAATMTPEPPKPMSFEEQIQHEWRTRPDIRAEFVSLTSYEAYCRAVRDGRTKVYSKA